MGAYPSTAKANVARAKLGPPEKKMWATMPSVLPFHSGLCQRGTRLLWAVNVCIPYTQKATSNIRPIVRGAATWALDQA